MFYIIVMNRLLKYCLLLGLSCKGKLKFDIIVMNSL